MGGEQQVLARGPPDLGVEELIVVNLGAVGFFRVQGAGFDVEVAVVEDHLQSVLVQLLDGHGEGGQAGVAEGRCALPGAVITGRLRDGRFGVNILLKV